MDLKDLIHSLKEVEDRRKYPRVLLDLPLEYRTEFDCHPRGGIVIDASEIGFLIHSTENMLLRTQLKIAVLYPCEYCLAKLDVYAEIVWKKFDNRGKRYLYGLRFNAIHAEDQSKLKGLLRGNSEPPPPTQIRPS